LVDEVPETAVALDAVLAGLCAVAPEHRFANAQAALAALVGTGLCDGDGPDLLRRFVKAPVQTVRAERARLAVDELVLARRLEAVAGAAPAAALAAHRATLLDPTRTEAVALRNKIAARHSFRFDDAPIDNEELRAIDAELHEEPDNVALLLQRARVFHRLGDVRREAATLWRAARIKNDPALVERARTMLAGPEQHHSRSDCRRFA
jgi:hypothetical protein